MLREGDRFPNPGKSGFRNVAFCRKSQRCGVIDRRGALETQELRFRQERSQRRCVAMLMQGSPEVVRVAFWAEPAGQARRFPLVFGVDHSNDWKTSAVPVPAPTQ
jgi:hypothetical protein